MRDIFLFLLFLIFLSCSKSEVGEAGTTVNEPDTETEIVSVFGELKQEPIPLGSLEKVEPVEIKKWSRLVETNGLRLRSAPDVDSDIIATLSGGTIVKDLDRSDRRETIGDYTDYWYQVSLNNGNTGWVFGAYLGYLSYEDQVEEAQDFLKQNNFTIQYVNENGVNGRLRWGPAYGGYGLYIFWYSNGLVTFQSPQAGVYGMGWLEEIQEGEVYKIHPFDSALKNLDKINTETEWKILPTENNLRYLRKLSIDSNLELYNLDIVRKTGETVEINGFNVTTVERKTSYLNDTAEILLTPDASSTGSFLYENGISSSYLPKGWHLEIVGQVEAPYSDFLYVVIGQAEFSRGSKNGFFHKSVLSDTSPDDVEGWGSDGFIKRVIQLEGNSYKSKIEAPNYLAFHAFSELLLLDFAMEYFDSFDKNNIELTGFSTTINNDGIELEIFQFNEGELGFGSINLFENSVDLPFDIEIGLSKAEVMEKLELKQDTDTIRINDNYISFWGDTNSITLQFENDILNMISFGSNM